MFPRYVEPDAAQQLAMLVDSHCHLDFPDFADELDAVVGARASAGIGRIVTISTRVKRHVEVLAIAERFPTCFARWVRIRTTPTKNSTSPSAISSRGRGTRGGCHRGGWPRLSL